MPSSRSLITLILLFAPIFILNAHADEFTFVGIPYAKTITTSESAQREILTSLKSSEFKLAVTKNGDSFFWTSRESKPLVKNLSGIYLLLINPSGAGYVKISLVDGSYIEHLNMHLQTITYYGKINDIEPIVNAVQ